MRSFILIFRTVTDCMQNGHHFLSSLLNTQIHMSMKPWRLYFSLAMNVISSVVNMTSEKYNVSELSIFLRSKMKNHWVRATPGNLNH